MGCLCFIWNSNGISRWQKRQSCWAKRRWCESCHIGSDVPNVYGGSGHNGQMAAAQKAQRDSPAQRHLQAKSGPNAVPAQMYEHGGELSAWRSQAVVLSTADDWRQHNFSSSTPPPIPAPPAANLDHLQDKCPSSDQQCFFTQHRWGSSKRLELIRLCEAECQDETKGRREH